MGLHRVINPILELLIFLYFPKLQLQRDIDANVMGARRAAASQGKSMYTAGRLPTECSVKSLQLVDQHEGTGTCAKN